MVNSLKHSVLWAVGFGILAVPSLFVANNLFLKATLQRMNSPIVKKMDAIRRDGTKTNMNLIPEIFSENLDEAEINLALKKSGFVTTGNGEGGFFGMAIKNEKIQVGEIEFKRSIPDISCLTHYYVLVKFDEARNLEKAIGEIDDRSEC